MKLIKFNKFLILLLFFLFSKNLTIANECVNKKEIKVGLIENNFIDYKYFLYYTLDDYSLKNSVEFNFDIVNNNADEFDIIFGEYKDLEKLSLKKISLPHDILGFYESNNIRINNNILPLDLDTFVILSYDEIEELNFEDISQYYSTTKYTLGMSFAFKERLFDLIAYNLGNSNFNLNGISQELVTSLFAKTYKNLNKNIIKNNYQDIYNSYENYENVFTLFSDGIFLYENIKFETYQLLPKSKYIWDNESGIFLKNNSLKANSFFGFSAYLNNIQSTGFICFLMKDENRLRAFKKFNIQISPLSIFEIKSIEEEIPDWYKKILINKNNNILNVDYSTSSKNYEDLIDVILNKKKYISKINVNDYLNR